MKIYADDIEITPIAGNIAWQNTLAELATTLSFEAAKLDAQYTSVYLPREGSIIRLVTDEEIFRGIVLSVDDGSKTANKYSAVDFGFYLNKNQETYQFTDAPANEAIRRVCADFGIPVDGLCDVGHTVSKIYPDQSAAEVIWDILEESGGGYNFDVTPRGLRVYRLGDFKAAPRFRLSPNTDWLDSAALRGNVGHSVSIEDMKNSVKVVSGDEKGFTPLATAQDATLIGRFGLLQAVEKIDEKEIGNAESISRQKLAVLARAKETFSFEIIEDENGCTRAGYTLDVENVLYLIEGTSHSVKNGIHYVKLDLRRFE
jgi:hypothetical protein